MQDKLIGFAKAHGFNAIANIDGKTVAIFIPTFNRRTGERDFVIEEVSGFSGARLALGY